MDKLAATCSIILFACVSLVSCNTTSEDQNTLKVEEQEDRAQDAADKMRDSANERDTAAVQVE